jgi:ElaB/YqjD/DUF883 family membrane-anchored ribosome-binding protein
MDPEPDVIRHNIEQTRSALTDKLETLENQVRGSVETAKAGVEDTIEKVRSTVNQTVESVKEAFDVRHHVRRHPWAMLGGSIAAGFLAGAYLEKRGRNGFKPAGARRPGPSFEERRERAAALESTAPVPPASSGHRPGLVQRLLHEFDDEIEQVKEVAIGASMGLLRDYLRRSLPQFEEQVRDVFDSATHKLGGKPIQPGSVEEETFRSESSFGRL